MNIANWLYQTALNWPERDAVLVGAAPRHSYSSLLDAVCARAIELSQRHMTAPPRPDRTSINTLPLGPFHI